MQDRPVLFRRADHLTPGDYVHFPFSLKNKADFDVVGFGTNSVDHLIRVPEYPRFTSKLEMVDHVLLPGGEVATTLVGLQRLGSTTSYAGRFGSDEAGIAAKRGLELEFVDLIAAEVVSGASNQLAYILIDEKSGERTVIWKRDDALGYRPEEAPIARAGSGKILHMTLHDAAACLEMAKTAHHEGSVVSVDSDRVFEGIEHLIPFIHVFIASSEFVRSLVGTPDVERGLRQIHHRYGCPVVGATLGVDGAVLLCEGRVMQSRAYPVPGGCIDTTGAGDAFRTGILYGLLTGQTVERSLKLANAVAALKCRSLGAQTALPTTTELIDFCSKNDI